MRVFRSGLGFNPIQNNSLNMRKRTKFNGDPPNKKYQKVMATCLSKLKHTEVSTY